MGLIEPLHEGRPLRSLQLCVARARSARHPLGTTIAGLLKWAYLPGLTQRPARQRWLLFCANRSGRLLQSVADRFQVLPAVVARAPRWEEPPRALAADFPIVKRDMVLSLYRGAAIGFVATSDTEPAVWKTFPYAHRPLLEFVLATPTLAFWDPASYRAGMKKAFADVLPPELLSRHAKANPSAVLQRADRDTAADLGNTEALLDSNRWLLVQRGYLEATAVANALAMARTASAPTSRLRKWVSLEAWLRTLSGYVSDASPVSRTGGWNSTRDDGLHVITAIEA